MVLLLIASCGYCIVGVGNSSLVRRYFWEGAKINFYKLLGVPNPMNCVLEALRERRLDVTQKWS